MQNVLVVDLKERTSHCINWDIKEVGAGLLGTLLLDTFFDLDGEAPLVISGGAISGISGVGMSVAYVVGHSPQSKGIIECKIEGRLASTLRYLNLASIVIRNSAESRVILKLDKNLNLEFIKADNLFGKNIGESNSWFQNRYGNNYLLATVAAAGDYGLANSSIVFDDGFPTSSGGLGADWGKRLLKSFAFEVGSVPSDQIVKDITDAYASRILGNPLTLSEMKSPGMGVWPVDPNLPGYLGAHNFSVDIAPAVTSFNPEDFSNFVYAERNLCVGCPQSCLKEISLGNVEGGFGFLHQQALPIWFSQLGITDIKGSLFFNQSSHLNGLEHSSVGTMLAFLAENSSTFTFGDGETALRYVRAWQSDPKSFPGGTGRLLDATTKENAHLMMQVKGIPLPPWDPRGAQGLGLIMAINPSGPRYDVVEHDIDFDLANYPAFTRESTLLGSKKYGIPESGFLSDNLQTDKVLATLNLWHLWSAMDALGICTYAGPPTRELTESHILQLYKAVTNSSLDFEKFIFLGKLRIEAQLNFNIKVKVPESLSTLPTRFFEEAVKSGPSEGRRIERQQFMDAKQTIYKASGWSIKGEPIGDSPVSKELFRLKELVKSNVGNL